MAKTVRSAIELEEIVMSELRKLPECEGATGITIQRDDDDSANANWYPKILHNGTVMCVDSARPIIQRLQREYKLS